MRASRLLWPLIIFAAFCQSWATPAGAAWKSDPNSPDSVAIPSIPWRGDTLIALTVSAATDDSLSVAQFVLAWPNPALRVDSVKFNIGRWNVPGYHRWSQPAGAGTVAVSFIPTQKRLPPGTGPVALIYCGRDSAYTFDSDFGLDTATLGALPPRAPFQTVFADLPGEAFSPAAVLGATIAFSPCICPDHGDAGSGGGIDATDLAIVIDAVFFGGPMPPTDPQCPHIHRGDINCDNTFDAVDLAVYIDHIFFGGAPPCDPCEDL